MKAKHISQLRRRFTTFERYRIRKSAGLFGDFFGHNSLHLIMDDYYVMADNHETALRRFFELYERAFKRKHELYSDNPCETTEMWASLMVENIKTKKIKFYR